MPGRTERKNNRKEVDTTKLDLESQIKSLFYMSGNERELLEKFIKAFKFKEPIKDVILSYFEKGEFKDVISCGQVFKLIRTNCLAVNGSGLSSRMFAESMKDLGFARGMVDGKSYYRHIKFKELQNA